MTKWTKLKLKEKKRRKAEQRYFHVVFVGQLLTYKEAIYFYQ